MTAEKDKNATERRISKGKSNRASVRDGDPHVARALRNAYETAVSEDVPQEFIDLLGKLA